MNRFYLNASIILAASLVFGGTAFAGVTVNMSAPVAGASLSSPVQVTATATPSSGNVITGWIVYVDNVQTYTGSGLPISHAVAMSTGAHTVHLRVWDSSGVYGDDTASITVVPDSVQVTMSAPTAGESVSSPVQVTATASPTSGNAITGWIVYVDNVQTYTGSGLPISHAVAMSTGTHTVHLRVWDSSGVYGDDTASITVIPDSVQVDMSSPQAGDSTNSPVQVTATATPTSGNSITGWIVYVDNAQAASGSGLPINKSVAMSPGDHAVRLRVWDSSGAYSDASASITIMAVSVDVNMTSPQEGDSSASPIAVSATATPSEGSVVTGWIVYLDDSEVANGSGSPISASIAASAGSHHFRLTVWDSSGASDSADANVTVTQADAVSVNLSSPADGVTVGSPISMSATAVPTSGHVVTGWIVYLDNKEVANGNGTPMSASVVAGSGSHDFRLSVWDSSGASSSVDHNVIVSTPPSPDPTPSGDPFAYPSNAEVISNIQSQSGWTDRTGSAATCPPSDLNCGAPTATYKHIQIVNDPAPLPSGVQSSGKSGLFQVLQAASGQDYADVLYLHNFGAGSSGDLPVKTHQIYDVWFRASVDNKSAGINQEFDIVHVDSNGYNYDAASQCAHEGGGAGHWQGFDQAATSGNWQNTGAPCPEFQPNTWHHFKMLVTFDLSAHTYTYETIQIDGVNYPGNFTGHAKAGGGWGPNNVAVQVQLDQNGSGAPISQWIENFKLISW